LSAGVHFFTKKVDDLFSRCRLNIPPNLSHPAKTSCPAGCTYTFFL